MMLIAVLAAMAMVASACGSDDDAPAAAVATTAAPVVTTAAPEAAPEEVGTVADQPAEEVAASLEPIKVMTIAPIDSAKSSYQNIFDGATLYEQYINDRGGVGGHPLEVITCDGKGDPNEAAACARKAVDEGVVAILGHFEFDMSVAMPILEEAGIAVLGSCCPVKPAEFASPVNFIFGSTNAMQHAVTYIMNEDGCESPVFAYLDLYTDYLTALAEQSFAHFGVYGDNAKFVSVPATPGDFTAQAAEAADSGDCIWLSMSAAAQGAFVAAMKTVGADMRIYGAQGNLTSVVAEAYPELTEGSVVLNAYPNLVDPVWDEYRASIVEYDGPEDGNWNSLSGLGVWAAYVAFNDIAETIDGDVTAASFLAMVRDQDAFQTMWGPTIDLSAAEGPMPGFPRVLNLQITFDRIINGELTPTGIFADMTDAVQAG